jgi:hypothetical protein
VDKDGKIEPKPTGNCPVIWLLDMVIACRAVWGCPVGSSDPVNELLPRFRLTIVASFVNNQFGMLPDKLLLDKSSSSK